MIPKKIIIFLYLLDLVFYSCSALLYRFGLNPSFETEPAPWDNVDILFFDDGDDLTSSQFTPETLKSLLPVLDYPAFADKHRQAAAPAESPECSVCLQSIDAGDRVRKLGNCCHAFHVGCLDRWLDLGRFSCPLCRSAVVPARADLAGRQKGPLTVLKILMGTSPFVPTNDQLQ
ncbi:RING-H2 finger protein ATL1 [Platanthera zijinensis]|uniref:RING-H2 finger protein ATL1 n=1 Tax=Platanthera zijinensis TaxID=2320716 RepID=A0AAP0BBV8_9ASPA